MKKNTEKFGKSWTRRKFLTRVGMMGGATALYETMVAMNMVNIPNQDWDGPPQLAPNQGQGQSVLILGAGIGGLTTAYILSRAGYRCQILEASHRAGGRNHTGRRGDTIIEEREVDGKIKQSIQEVKFDSDLYINLGPGRLPYHHRRVLGYCQELEVKLEPYLMNTTGNLFQSDRNNVFDDPSVYRKIQNDTRGHIAELLAKAVNKGALDEELKTEDQKQLILCLLEAFGSLTNEAADPNHAAQRAREGLAPQCQEDFDLKYEGTTRDGCAPDGKDRPTPNVFSNCVEPSKISLDDLLESQFWLNSFYDPIEFEWQPTLFQPVGGMDKIVEGFLRKVGHLITYNAPVTKIRSYDDGVEVTYLNGASEQTIKADYCVSNIPCPILSKLDTNFEEDKRPEDYDYQNWVPFKEAVDNTNFAPSCKVGWQANSRFWENNYEIYGGISWTNDIIEQIWYPSNDYFSQKGTLTGAYVHGKNAERFGEFDLEKRLRIAKRGAQKLHPEFGDNTLVPTELGVSIAWQYVPHQEGAWPDWTGDQSENDDYERILRPFRRFYIVGDQASTLPGWQEGAMMSAEHVVELITGTVSEADFPAMIVAPNTFKVMQGKF